MADAINNYLFYEIAALLILAAGIGFVGLLLRQPLIVSFIAVGILAGPSVLNIARSDAQIDLLAELGIAVLLFLVGLKLDVRLVRSLGRVALFTGLGQVAFTSLFGFLIAVLLGFDIVASLYIAVALTFSSTIIIVKLLSDKREIDSLHGRIALGFLIVQDIVVVLAMIVLSAVGAGSAAGTGAGEVAKVVLYAAAMLLATGLFITYLAKPLVERLSRSPELMVSFAIGWAALFAAAGHYLGFGKELGGLLAGVSVASTPFRDAISARLASLRDFLLLFFFIALGASLDLSTLGDSIPAAAVFSIFVLIGNPLIVLVIMGLMRYRARTGFLAGLTVAQISEFSLIFMAMGVSLGHVGGEALGMVTLVGMITIALSTYMITYSHWLYARLARFLHVFERASVLPIESQDSAAKSNIDVLIFGMGRYGQGIATRLQAEGLQVLGIDFDPSAVGKARREGLDARFGDASDPEFLAHLPIPEARWVVSTMPSHDTGLTHINPFDSLLSSLRSLGFQGRIAVAAFSSDEAESYRNVDDLIVLSPYVDAAARGAEIMLETDLDRKADSA
jgi:Kef-type K+ transport system membrane component KefB